MLGSCVCFHRGSMQTSILIVDDDPGFGRAAAEMLTARGYRVLGQATSVAAALEQCDQLDPDAVLVDVRLPDGDGVALAEELRARPHAPMGCSHRPTARPCRRRYCV